MTVVAVGNQKGGVGKTSITVGLADVLAGRGRHVLVIDVDPQANATAHLDVASPSFTLNDVLAGDSRTRKVSDGVIVEAAVPAGPAWPGIEVVAAERALAAREQDQDVGREQRLRTALRGVGERWDVVLLDCPPSLGQLTVNALTAADTALLVTEPRAGSVDGLAQMVDTLAAVRDSYHPELRLGAIALNRWRPDRRDRVEWLGQLRATYGPLLVEPFLPEREVVAVAASAAAPLRGYGAAARDLLAGLAAIADCLSL